MNLLEICVDSTESAVKAEKSGANRLELCENLIQGGVTPSIGKIEAVLNTVNIPVRVLIRPRAGNFNYSQDELDIIYRDIELISKTSAEGIVVGALNGENEIDPNFLDKCKSLLDNKTVVFHRAFDLTKHPENAIELLIQYDFDTVLTSGQKSTAEEGIELLSALQRKYGSKINVLAGGGVRSSNLKKIYDQTRITQFHSSAKILLSDHMDVSMSSSSVAEQVFSVDSNEISKMIDLINEF